MKNEFANSAGIVYNGTRIAVAASNLSAFQGGRFEIRVRKGTYRHMSCGFFASILPYNETAFLHTDNTYADYTSSSDARLKTERTDVTGEQALSVLSNMQAQTYWREDLEQRRIGLIADEVEDAVSEIDVDNIISSMHGTFNGEAADYKTLDYSRLVSLLIPACNALSEQVTTLAARVQELEMTTTKKRKTNGAVPSKSS